MEKIDKDILQKLYKPPKESHKGQNGKLMIIGGSKLFHGASLWALKTASRIVDMVSYSTVKENEELTKKLKSEIYDFICVPRSDLDSYVQESDAILIGCGMTRNQRPCRRKSRASSIETSGKHILKTKKEQVNWENDTRQITKYLLAKFPDKKWIIDAGSLQVMNPEWLKKLPNAIITPHRREFEDLFRRQITDNRKQQKKAENGEQKFILQSSKISHQPSAISHLAKEFGCTIVLKGATDIICSPKNCLINQSGNEGMTKGGTGDVLAGLIAGLACKNDLFLAGCAGVFINGLAGDSLYKKVGPYFNASDLCEEIPIVMGKLIG